MKAKKGKEVGKSQSSAVEQDFKDESALSTDEQVDRINELEEEHVGRAQIVIGLWILVNVFNNDLKAALSKNPRKESSFKAICAHKKLRRDPATLTWWVRVAAVTQELELAGLDTSQLSYSQLRELCKLFDAASRLEMAKKLIEQQLTVEETVDLVQQAIAEERESDVADAPRLSNVAKEIVQGLRDPLSLPDNATVVALISDGTQLREDLRVGEMAEIITRTREAKGRMIQQKRGIDRRLAPVTRAVNVLDQILKIFVDQDVEDDHQE